MSGLSLTNNWIGCGECDHSFPCNEGQQRCIRLPEGLNYFKVQEIAVNRGLDFNKFSAGLRDYLKDEDDRIQKELDETLADLERYLGPRKIPWIQVIDEALVVHHIGIADPQDDYETAKRKLNALLCVVQDIGEYFAKNGK